MAKHLQDKIMMNNSDLVPNDEKYLGLQIKDPEIKSRVAKLSGDVKINTAKFFNTLDWLLSLLRKEIENNKIKENKNE